MAGDSQLDPFYLFASELTGFDRFDLEATGQGEAYLKCVRANADADMLESLFQVWAIIEAEVPPEKRAAAIAKRIMAVDGLREVAQGILMLWYTGSWYEVATGASSTLSGSAYVEGLMWKAIGSHPMAAKPQGYAAWTLPPPEAP
ncbi:MAG TPA: hypothetical protein VJS15_01145 [Allosphingosinicella sp.]|nr:hypothetical protein [Allosphingosinicella sp.]